MPLLVRKINKAKWQQIDLTISNDASGDAITNCLKTKSNTLSVWMIDSENQIDDAFLALLANQDRIETIDVVMLDFEKIEQHIQIVQEPGNTPMESMVDAHRDLSNITYAKIGIIKDYIIEELNNKKTIRRTKSYLKDILKKAIEEGKIKMDNLKFKV